METNAIDPPVRSDGEYIVWLEAKVERLQAIVLEQKELWGYVKHDLNALDDSQCRVRFMKLHDPIGKCKAAEAAKEGE